MESGQLTILDSRLPGMRMAGFGLAILLLIAAVSATCSSGIPASQPEPSPTITPVATDAQPERRLTAIPELEPTNTAESSPATAAEPDSVSTQIAGQVRADSWGVERWRVFLESGAPAYSDVSGMAIDDMGNVFVAGWSWGTFRETIGVCQS